jgi:putative membrane protein
MKLLVRLAVAAGSGMLGLVVMAPAQAGPASVPAPSTAKVWAAPNREGHCLCRQDRTFLVRAHQGNLAEIAAGRLALAKSQNTDVRHIARRLIADHTKLDAQIRAAAKRYHVTLPTQPSAKQMRQLKQVAHRSGHAFDRAWLRLQEKSHVQTLALIHREVHHGCSADVRKLARTAAPVVREHLVMVRKALHRM